ncbi:NAD(+) diphosphatase [Lacisediminihabitans changchengi]|uniref:NAD(+) diphosphatase n=1 Tax=Lacisediminihabitans changchengi TaxID=2787634 RepID=A0A934SIM8_9MICO|nr:NAD(+) diphosphatase [Lacisediminihabitans changchengi]MBK4347362.1 NAD(+) diphosphatase [Lacisediminihabitans changchengi]
MTREFLSLLPLSRHELDRDYLSRNRPELLDELWADDSTLVLPLHSGEALLEGDDALRLLPPSRVPRPDLLLYLGKSLAPESLGVAIVAAVLSDEAADILEPDPAGWANLRLVGNRLSTLHAGLFTAALALANWHLSHPFSPKTGEPTEPGLGGWVRVQSDGKEIFPRTDAAIIVGIVDSHDRILLGSNAMWATNRYSLLAGFVEPGESLENAVIREVFEESGIRVIDPVYLGSQPWPFPASLMVGFLATVDPDVESTLTPDGNEILDLRWFSRDELTAALGEIGLPGHTSIARAILEHWYGGPINDSVQW